MVATNFDRSTVRSTAHLSGGSPARPSLTRSSFVKGSSALLGSAALLAAGVGTVGSVTSALAEEADSESGTIWTATAMGKDGEVAVSLTFDGERITAIDATCVPDTPGIGDVAAKDVCERILANQNVEVDAATGATITSFAVRSAAEAALEAAGADVEAFRKGSDLPATEDKPEGDAEDWDIVIAGSGFSGINAAIMAKRLGVERVLVLEKAAYCGGCSGVIGGWISIWNSPYNEESGLNCTLEDYTTPLLNRDPTQPPNDERDYEWLKNMYEIGGDVFTYLYEAGVPMDASSAMPGNYEGNTIQFCATGHLEYPWDKPERHIYQAMYDAAVDLGVEIRALSPVTALLHEGNVVTGVRVEDRGSVYSVNAKKVILATGGFQWNSDYMEQYCPSYKDVYPFAAGKCTGDAITMTRELDVPIEGTDGCSCFCGLNSVVGYMGRIGWLGYLPQLVLSANGTNLGVGGPTSDTIVSQPGGFTYGIFDRSTPYLDRVSDAVARGYCTRVETLQDLADYVGGDYGQVQYDVQRNGLSESGPFYVIEQHPCNIMTLPGLKVDALDRVQNADGEIVGNLYCVGCAILGNAYSDMPESCFDMAYVATTNSVTEAILSGAVAARDAVENM